jgi:tRNA uridine 5-carboxymethylaminomethyl modification enzyme
LPPTEQLNKILVENGSSNVSTGVKLSELIRRPELSYDILAPADKGRPERPENCPGYVWDAVREQVNIQVKYEGYINLQSKQVEAFKKLEKKRLPGDIDYSAFNGLRLEARQKQSDARPENIGQASRITGVSPADIQVLLVYLKSKKII